jgi:hypothetical protein
MGKKKGQKGQQKSKDRDAFDSPANNPLSSDLDLVSSISDEESESDEEPDPVPSARSVSKKPAAKKKSAVKKKPSSHVTRKLLGVPLFSPRLFQVYFFVTLLVEMLILILLWSIQLQVETDESYSLVVMLGGVLVGVQLSQASGHWKASKDRAAAWQTAVTIRGQVLRGERVKWHVGMIFYPIVVMIIMTFVYNIGLYTLVVYYTGTQGVCTDGLWAGMSAITSDVGQRLVYSFSFLYFALLVFMSLLSITHYKQYMTLHTFQMLHSLEAEGDDEADVDLNSSTLFKARYIRRLYLMSVLTQSAILLTLTAGKESTDEPNLLSWQLSFGVFLLGWQVGVGERHLHYDAEIDPSGDDSLIRDRSEWHGSMMFYPCAVSVMQCFYNFSALFTLLPYFNDDCAQTSIGSILANLDSTGFWIFASNVVLFVLTFIALLWLCVVHFVQFQILQDM